MQTEEAPNRRRNEYRVYTSDSPDDLYALFAQARGPFEYLCRGQSDTEYELKTSLERHAREGERQSEELRMLYEFKRRAHFHIELTGQPVPMNDDLPEWLTILQHYGGPTRLLDFSLSPFVAAYFAIREPKPCDAAIWVIDPGGVAHNELLNSIDSDISELPMPNYMHMPWAYGENREARDFRNKLNLIKLLNTMNPPAGLVRFDTARMNRRISAQLGTFLAPCNANKPFMENLREHFNLGDCIETNENIRAQDFIDLKSNVAVMKIIIPLKARATYRAALFQMNIREEVLFPDLQGLVRGITDDGVPGFGTQGPK